jgi:uncharacterized membrane protein YeaQ/YmgE (transglycosylase-associated protein family)
LGIFLPQWQNLCLPVTSLTAQRLQNPLFSGLKEEFMFLSLVWWVIVGLIAGWATGKIMGGGGYGVITDILLGIAGALVGGWIMRLLGFAGQGGLFYTIIVAIGGAVLLTWLFRLITRGKAGTGAGGIRKAA